MEWPGKAWMCLVKVPPQNASATSSVATTVPIPNIKPPGVEMSKGQEKNKDKGGQSQSL